MNKKIALVYDAIYPYIKGGGEKRYYEIAKRLVIKGYDVHLYGMKLWQGSSVIKKEGIFLHGICSVKSLYIKNGKRSIWQAMLFGINCFKLFKEDFDVIDCCGFPYFSLFTCKLVSIVKRKKLYSTWHEVWGLNYWRKYLGKLAIFGYIIELMAVHMPNKIIAVSRTTAQRIKNELGYKDKIEVIPNGVDLKFIEKIKPSKKKSDLIYAGRLMDFKHIDILIKAVSKLKKKIPKVNCIIVGDGPEKKKLELLVKKLNLENNIKFLGFLDDHNDLYALIKSSKVFVLPSTREGFGIVAIEANACGIPVITINHKNNAAKDLIEEGKNGYLSKLDADRLSNCIRKFTSVDQSRSIQQYCKNIASTYKWENLIQILKQTYV